MLSVPTDHFTSACLPRTKALSSRCYRHLISRKGPSPCRGFHRTNISSRPPSRAFCVLRRLLRPVRFLSVHSCSSARLILGVHGVVARTCAAAIQYVSLCLCLYLHTNTKQLAISCRHTKPHQVPSVIHHIRLRLFGATCHEPSSTWIHGHCPAKLYCSSTTMSNILHLQAASYTPLSDQT